ncbi:hypothetical protein CEE37_12255 [candidate division LCP-89 bacterium B3_LCP]|uniref:LysM domain-containing protein n=1 Tax=candidate division LCP-89 bacterium B3_LCP TaxID=2012998 RepID=A0A532UUB2_UNCL8|nr:MAG: hypothetical protein CEE37_12255 [candidate division LCP-89 bacterium B3_LCP]
MFKKGSRYEKARTFDPDADGSVVLNGVRPRKIGKATGMVMHTVKAGERIDLLAHHYYNDDRLWWRIVDANPEFFYGGNIITKEMEGSVIMIPKAKE